MKLKVEVLFPEIKLKRKNLTIDIPNGLVGHDIDTWLFKNQKKILTKLGAATEILESYIKRGETIVRRIYE